MRSLLAGGAAGRLLPAARPCRRRTLARQAASSDASRAGGNSSVAPGAVDSAASLERLYLASAPGAAPRPPRAAAQQPAAQPEQQQQQQQQPERPRHVHVEEVCAHGAGLHLCVEHTVDDETGAEVAPAVPLEGPAGALARLLDLIPLSKRTRGILMLNLLVLLVATNWVRGQAGEHGVMQLRACGMARARGVPAIVPGSRHALPCNTKRQAAALLPPPAGGGQGCGRPV